MKFSGENGDFICNCHSGPQISRVRVILERVCVCKFRVCVLRFSYIYYSLSLDCFR